MNRVAKRICTAFILACVGVTPAVAQLLLDKSLQDPAKDPANRTRRAPSATLSPMASAPWPRLDVGSLVCRTREDLDAHNHAIAARLDGEPSPNAGSIDCRIITAMTAIEIVSRVSPAATEVRLKGEPGTEWTDTWLPPRQPK